MTTMPQEGAPQANAGQSEKDALAEMIKKAATSKEASDIFNTLGEGLLTREEFVALMRERQAVRSAAVKALAGSKPEEQVQNETKSETPKGAEIAEEKPKPKSRKKTAKPTPETVGESSKEGGALPSPQEPAPNPALETAPEAAPPATEEAAFSNDDGTLNMIVEDINRRREERWQKRKPERISDEKTGRKRAAISRLAKGGKPSEEELRLEEATQLLEEKFQPTPAMLELSSKIDAEEKEARRVKERIALYKRLDQRTFRALEELQSNFRSVSLLKRELENLTAQAKEKSEARRAAAQKEVANLLRGRKTKPPLRFRLGDVPWTQVTKKEARKPEHHRRNFEEFELAFGEGKISKEALVRLRAAKNTQEELETLFAEGEVDEETYKSLSPGK